MIRIPMTWTMCCLQNSQNWTKKWRCFEKKWTVSLCCWKDGKGKTLHLLFIY
ncbi:unnamed protein product [Haemonchus placei]|uniref:Uncharacterized protein n=1 Tax=Haemonchus placei TaxID=6290 RepID=A0A0N4VY30_HAEPC|nr:unnamed protein product [Haemonchus placei]